MTRLKIIFSNVNNGEFDYIEATIGKDVSKTPGEAFIEVHKRIRPGDLATEDNARGFLEAMLSFEKI